jgi:regulator of cell morphogenesis and NO signaling
MISKESIIKELTSENRELEPIIERLGFTGKLKEGTIKEACECNLLDADFVVEILKTFDDTGYFPKEELLEFPLNYILDYLRKTHQFYLNKKIPEIEQSLQYFKRYFSDGDASQVLLSELFLAYKKNLAGHIRYEEEKLFPYIESLLKNEVPLNYSISKFIAEHHNVEEDLSRIRAVIVKHSVALDSMPYRIFLHQLNAFQMDLYKHALVEDEVLIPKALALENEVKNTF